MGLGPLFCFWGFGGAGGGGGGVSVFSGFLTLALFWALVGLAVLWSTGPLLPWSLLTIALYKTRADAVW